MLYDFLIATGPGGHASMAIKLAEMLPGRICFIIPYLDKVMKHKIRNDYFAVPSPRFKPQSNILMTMIRTVFLFFLSFIILLFTRVRVVFSTGAGIAVPVLLAAKVLGKKTVFVESASRVYVPSATGKLLLGRVTIWLSTWFELTKYADSIVYIGLLA